MIGFYNTSSNCYLNSALQALLSIEDFRKNIIKNRNKHHLLATISDFAEGYHENQIANPSKLKQQLSQMSHFFRQNGQQDAHECIVNLLDTIHEILRTTKKDKNPAFNDYLRVFGFSFITNLFAGQLCTQFICSNCNKARETHETFMDLSIPVSNGHRNLLDSLTTFGSHELLGDPIMCDGCRASTKTYRVSSISKFPNILLITLVNPNKVPIGIPEILNISREQRSGANKMYVLSCVINHIGTLRSAGGHYFCTVRNDGKWVMVDDTLHIPLRTMEWPSGSPYVLVYESTSIIA